MDPTLAQLGAKVLASTLKALTKPGVELQDQPDLERLLPAHLQETANWAKDVQLYGMTQPQEADATVPLLLDSIPRKFRTIGETPVKVDEAELLNKAGHILLLGDPGSGKTTLIKRLIRRLLLQTPTDRDSNWNYPVLVRLRLIDSDAPIFAFIADKLGLHYTIMTVRSESGKPISRYLVGSRSLDIVLAELLDSTGALVLLDGLDEVASVYRKKLESSIREFSFRLGRSCIILSCRSGDFQRTFEGFTLFELCPLDSNQVREVARRWLPDSRPFLRTLKEVPYNDLVDRPLFLCQLLMLFRRSLSLPAQPASVYHSTTRLMLEDWDRRRGVERATEYAFFTPDDKLEFLAAFAHELTYKLKMKNFATEDLAIAYRQIRVLFELPKNESRQVAEEIQTHTGILVQAGPESYEFSHLSLQEYLCGHYLVRDPFSDLLPRYVQEYPSPIAVAVAISANPSNWLAGLFLRERPLTLQGEQAKSFLVRLVQERPRFKTSVGLGFVSLWLLSLQETATPSLATYLAQESVEASVRRALQCYELEKGSARITLRVTEGSRERAIRWRAPLRFHLTHSLSEAVERALGSSFNSLLSEQ